jgi:hypothetical protein
MKHRFFVGGGGGARKEKLKENRGNHKDTGRAGEIRNILGLI